uniref:Uncharacterized protein n=1 Tax=Arundo donax TaxID=35708 RepID=A0A0A9BLV1_ARUDO
MVAKACRRTFDSIVILCIWSIWKERNARVFRNQQVTTASLVQLVVDEALLWDRVGIVIWSDFVIRE